MSEKRERNYEHDVDLDGDRLEWESFRQPTLYMYWAARAVQARTDEDAVKGRLALRSAEIEIAVRNTEAKLTEKAVLAHLETNPELIGLRDELLRASHLRAELDAAVRAMTQKKDMIENATRLYLSGYYSTPEGGTETDKTQAQTRQALNRKKEN